MPPPTEPPCRLVNPKNGRPLHWRDGAWVGDDGTVFSVHDGIVDLLDSRCLDDAARSELAVFENIPLERVSYFRPALFDRIVRMMCPALVTSGCPPICVELGGGEGYLARAFIESAAGMEGYVLDLSLRHLGNADPRLHRIRCDVRRPSLAPGQAGLAAFWVSLHHLSLEDGTTAVRMAADMLAPGGYLLAFEPSSAFFPRNLFYMTPLRRLVYFDEAEKALDPRWVVRQAENCGLTTRFAAGVNPPYALGFLRHFKGWPFFFAATEALHGLDRLRKRGKRWWTLPGGPAGTWPGGLASGSYLLAVFEKPR